MAVRVGALRKYPGGSVLRARGKGDVSMTQSLRDRLDHNMGDR